MARKVKGFLENLADIVSEILGPGGEDPDEEDGEDDEAEEDEDTQCAAETNDGARCSRNAEPGSSYCWQHGNDSLFPASDSFWGDDSLFAAPGDGSDDEEDEEEDEEDEEEDIQCAAETKDGTPCSRNAEPGSSYCWQHGDYI
jgi:hypothetical protein